MDEYWTTVKGNNDYAVSTFGNVENMITGGRILQPQIDTTTGYYKVILNKNGKLVAEEAFLDNPDEKLC
eukprot:gene18364-25869_t